MAGRPSSGGGVRPSSGGSRSVGTSSGGSHRIGSSSSSRPSSSSHSSFSSSRPSSTASKSSSPSQNKPASRPASKPVSTTVHVDVRTQPARKPTPLPPPPVHVDIHTQPARRPTPPPPPPVHVDIHTHKAPPPQRQQPKVHVDVHTSPSQSQWGSYGNTTYRQSSGTNHYRPAGSTYIPPSNSNHRKRKSKAPWAFFVLFSLLLVLVVVAGASSRGSVPASSYSRDKLEGVPGYRTDNVVDELGWFGNTSRVSSRLKEFYNKTGVQPYILLKSYDSKYVTEEAQESWTADYYDNTIGLSNGFLIVYFEESDPDMLGNVVYWCGSSTTSVMDAEATEIFFGYLDRYWDTDMSADDLFVKTFVSTSDKIMQRSKSASDVLFVLAIIVLIIALGITVVVIIKTKRKAERERAEETERILSQPLPPPISSTAEEDAIMNKYND